MGDIEETSSYGDQGRSAHGASLNKDVNKGTNMIIFDTTRAILPRVTRICTGLAVLVSLHGRDAAK